MNFGVEIWFIKIYAYTNITLIYKTKNADVMESGDEFDNVKPLKKRIQQLETQLRESDLRFGKQKSTISALTTGYLKDIHHLREMVFRKDFVLDDHEFYEVQYLDTTLVLDPNLREILNEKLASLK